MGMLAVVLLWAVIPLVVGDVTGSIRSYTDVDRRQLSDSTYPTLLGHHVPYVWDISPRKGPPTGGTTVTIRGENFHSSPYIVCEFGSVTVSGTFTDYWEHVQGDYGSVPTLREAVSCVSPALKPGNVSLEVSFDSGRHFTNEGVLFQVYEPEIASLEPTSGPISSATVVNITAGPSSFEGADYYCSFGNESVVKAVVADDFRSMTCTTDPGALSVAPGTEVALEIASDANKDGVIDSNFTTQANSFVFHATPAVTAVHPSPVNANEIPAPTTGDITARLVGNNLNFNSSLAKLYVRIGRKVVPAVAAVNEGSGLFEDLVFIVPHAHDAGVLAERRYRFGSSYDLDRMSLSLRGDASISQRVMHLTTLESNKKGSLVAAFDNVPPLQGFRVEFDMYIGGGEGYVDRYYGGNGLSFSAGIIESEEVVGELGSGQGLRVLFRTRTAKAIDIIYGGRLVYRAPAVLLRLGVWTPVVIEMTTEGELTVCHNFVCHVDRIAIAGWKWLPGWSMAFGARTTDVFDEHAIDNLVVRSGALVISGAANVSVSFNDQDYKDLNIAGDAVHVRYHAPPLVVRVTPDGGHLGGGKPIMVEGFHMSAIHECRFHGAGKTEDGDSEESVVVSATYSNCDDLRDEYQTICRPPSDHGCFERPASDSCCTAMWAFQNAGCATSDIFCDDTLASVFATDCTDTATYYKSTVICDSPQMGFSTITDVSVSTNGQDYQSNSLSFTVYNGTASTITSALPSPVDAAGGALISLIGDMLEPPTESMLETTKLYIGDATNPNANASLVVATWNTATQTLDFIAPPRPAGANPVSIEFNTLDIHAIGELLYVGPGIQERIFPTHTLEEGENLITVHGSGFEYFVNDTLLRCHFGSVDVHAVFTSPNTVNCHSPSADVAGVGVQLRLIDKFRDTMWFAGDSQTASKQTVKYVEGYSLPFEDVWEVVAPIDLPQGSTPIWSFDTIVASNRDQGEKTIAQTSTSFNLNLDDAEGTWAKLKSGLFGLGSISVQIYVTARGAAGVAFRYVDDLNYYAFDFHPDSTQVNNITAFRRLKRVVNGQHTILAYDEVDTALYTWNDLYISCLDGISMSVFWNGEEILSAHENEPSLVQGTVALGAWAMNNVYFGDFEVDFVERESSVEELDTGMVTLLGSSSWYNYNRSVILTHYTDDDTNALDPAPGALLLNLVTFEPPIVFTAAFDVYMEGHSSGISFFYALSPGNTVAYDESSKAVGLSLQITPTTVGMYWSSLPLVEANIGYGDTGLGYLSNRWVAVNLNVDVGSSGTQEDARNGKVLISVEVDGIRHVDGLNLEDFTPKYKPTSEWLFGFGAADNTLQQVRDIEIDTNFYTGVDWQAPLAVSFNGRDTYMTPDDSITTIQYAHIGTARVLPGSVAYGSNETLLLSGTAVSNSTTGETGSYTYECSFVDVMDTSNVLGSSPAALVPGSQDGSLTCSAVPDILAGPCFLIIQVYSESAITRANPIDFAYLNAEISIVDPVVGDVGGGTVVRVTTQNARGGLEFSCMFNETIVDGTLVAENTIECVSPPNKISGVVDFRISLNGKDYSKVPSSFAFHEVPTITGFDPTSCSADGGCQVTFTGQNFPSSLAGIEPKCRMGSHISDGVANSPTTFTCIASSFEEAYIAEIEQAMANEVASGNIELFGEAALSDAEFFSPSTFKFLPQYAHERVVVNASQLRAEVKDEDGFEAVLLGPSLDYESTYEVNFTMMVPDSVFFGVAPVYFDLAASPAQADTYAYSSEGDAYRDGLVTPGAIAPFSKDSRVKMRWEAGTVRWFVDDVEQGEPVQDLKKMPYYFVVGDSSLIGGGFEVIIEGSKTEADFSALTLTDDNPNEYGSFFFQQLGDYGIETTNLTMDIWTGPSAARLLDGTAPQTGSDGFDFLVMREAHYASDTDISTAGSSIEQFSVSLSTYPYDSELLITSHRVTGAVCRYAMPPVREAGWRQVDFALDRDGKVCVTVTPSSMRCCNVTGEAYEDLLGASALETAKFGFRARTGDISDTHAFRSPRVQLLPPRFTSTHKFSISFNDLDFFPASQRFLMAGVGQASTSVLQPTNGLFNETVRIWGVNLNVGTQYTCVFENTEPTRSATATVPAYFDELSLLPAGDYDSSVTEPGPIRCEVPGESYWSTLPLPGDALLVKVTLNGQDEILNPNLLFSVVDADSMSIAQVFPHSGPRGGKTVFNVTIGQAISSFNVADLFCKLTYAAGEELLMRARVLDPYATSIDLLICETPENIQLSGQAMVSVTLNGQTFFGNNDEDISGYYFYDDPIITSVEPPQGLTTGGTDVIVFGTDHTSGKAGEYLCKFESTTSSRVEVVPGELLLSSLTVRCPTPPWGYQEVVRVRVSPNSQQYDTGDVPVEFLFYEAPTSIAGPEPPIACTAGGTIATFTSAQFVTGSDVRCRVAPPGGLAAIIVDATLDVVANTIKCPMPAVNSSGDAAVEIALFRSDFVAAGNAVAYYDNVILEKFEYHSGFWTGGTSLRIQMAQQLDATAISLFTDPVCRFESPFSRLIVNATIESDFVTCKTAPAADFDINDVSSVVCGMDTADNLCSGDDIISSLLGNAVASASLPGVLALTRMVSNAFGGMTLTPRESATCPPKMFVTATINPGSGNGGDGFFVSVGSAVPYSREEAMALPDSLVLYVSVLTSTVYVILDGQILLEDSYVDGISLGTFNIVILEILDGVLTVYTSSTSAERRLVPALYLPGDWLDTLTRTSTCHYTVGAATTDLFDAYQLDSFRIFGDVVRKDIDVSTTLTFGQNFVSNSLQFTYTADLVPKSIFPAAGPKDGGTVVTISCDRTSQKWQNVSCSFGIAGSVNATWNAEEGTVTCVTPAYPIALTQAITTLVEITVNEQHTVPVFAAEPIYFTYYLSPSINTLEPISGPKDGGTRVTLNVTNLMEVDWVDQRQGTADSGLEISCLFGDVQVEAFLTFYSSDAGYVECFSPDVLQRSGMDGPLPFRISINNNPDQIDQRIGSQSFTFYDLPFDMYLVEDTAILDNNTNTSFTDIQVAGVTFNNASDIRCKVGTKIVSAVPSGEASVSCTIPNGFVVGAANVHEYNINGATLGNWPEDKVMYYGAAADTAVGMRLSSTSDHVDRFGTVTVAPQEHGAPFTSFLASFDLLVDPGPSNVGSDGFSFSYGPMSSPYLGELGFGEGIRVAFRTHLNKSVATVVDGVEESQQYVGEHCIVSYFPDRKQGTWELIDCVPTNKVRDRTNRFNILWMHDHLSVWVGQQLVASHRTHLREMPSKDWKFAFGSRRGESGDGHLLNNLVLRMGAAVGDQDVPVDVTLNGQQYTRAGLLKYEGWEATEFRDKMRLECMDRAVTHADYLECEHNIYDYAEARRLEAARKNCLTAALSKVQMNRCFSDTFDAYTPYVFKDYTQL